MSMSSGACGGQGGYKVAVVLSIAAFIVSCRLLLYSAVAPAAWMHFAGAVPFQHPMLFVLPITSQFKHTFALHNLFASGPEMRAA